MVVVPVFAFFMFSDYISIINFRSTLRKGQFKVLLSEFHRRKIGCAIQAREYFNHIAH
jgi:hypothetical protein